MQNQKVQLKSKKVKAGRDRTVQAVRAGFFYGRSSNNQNRVNQAKVKLLYQCLNRASVKTAGTTAVKKFRTHGKPVNKMR
jgi:hypothetical protein